MTGRLWVWWDRAVTWAADRIAERVPFDQHMLPPLPGPDNKGRSPFSSARSAPRRHDAGTGPGSNNPGSAARAPQAPVEPGPLPAPGAGQPRALADWPSGPDCDPLDHRCRNRDGDPLRAGQACWIAVRRESLLHEFAERHPRIDIAP